jgi:hypothetical protein
MSSLTRDRAWPKAKNAHKQEKFDFPTDFGIAERRTLGKN